MASNANNWSFGKIVAVSAAAGIVVLLFLMLLLSFAFWSSFFWGLCVGAIVFLILWLNFSDPEDADVGADVTPAAVAMADEPGVAADDAGAALADSVVSDAADVAATVADEPGVEADDAAAALADAPVAEAAEVAGAVIKPSTALAGQAELAARKGSWKYEAPASGDGPAIIGGDSGGAAKADGGDPVADAPAAGDDLGEDYDKDGVREGTDEGAKPEMLSAARDGGADNLKEIKGVGPKMEQMLNEMGVYHFDQIAEWSADEVAWVDANLKGFKGRVSRDGWVDQAKILMTGAETEFSQRVEDGKVY